MLRFPKGGTWNGDILVSQFFTFSQLVRQLVIDIEYQLPSPLSPKKGVGGGAINVCQWFFLISSQLLRKEGGITAGAVFSPPPQLNSGVGGWVPRNKN